MSGRFVVRSDRKRHPLFHRANCQKAPEFVRDVTEAEIAASDDGDWCYLCCRDQAAEARRRYQSPHGVES